MHNHTVISRFSLQLGLPALLRTTLPVTTTSLVDTGIGATAVLRFPPLLDSKVRLSASAVWRV